MKHLASFIACFLVLLVSLPIEMQAQSVELRNNYFYLDGQKTFLKGIGYEVGALPGQLPWTRPFRPDVIRADMERIESGGFNTIRTWDAFTEVELDVIAEYDIYIIMGIWIDPHGDFGDINFINQARDRVAEVLAYSKNYDNIIAYLIMNEPLAATIADAGFGATESLWNQLISIIHNEHPGRPVSISNSSNGTYIDPAIFDYNAHNAYIYSPVTVNYLHGYRNYVAYLKSLGSPGMPLVMTEYGLSVSPTGPGDWGYGGNSLSEQEAGNLHMYKALVDGGASGSCMFNYSDGWWKGGNEFAHDDNPEEWFGLVEYENLSDLYGTERPVWDAVRDFQSAIVAQPQSGEVYGDSLPVEIFADDTIAYYEIQQDGWTLYRQEIRNGYLNDSTRILFTGLQDIDFDFAFFTSDSLLVKLERKNFLLEEINLELPSIDITIVNENFWDDGFLEVRYDIDFTEHLEPDGDLEFIYYPHQGFGYGDAYSMPLESNEDFSFTRMHTIGNDVNVITFGAAFGVLYGDFRKRIVNQKTVTRWDALSTGIEEVPAAASLLLYPNPAGDAVHLILPDKSNSAFHYELINVSGKNVQAGILAEGLLEINVSKLAPGLYLLRLTGMDGQVYSGKIVKD